MSDRIIFGFTSSCLIWDIAFLIASEDPCTSDLIIIFKSSDSLSLNADSWVKSVTEFFPSFASCTLPSDKDFASFSLWTTIKSSPDFAAPLIPKTSIGVEGSAIFMFSPLSFIIALTLPHLNRQQKNLLFLKYPL